MTEEELDILASSYLDGEATLEEVALVERDPGLMARVQQMRSIQAMVAAPPPVPGALKEQHLAAALASFGGADRRASLSAVDGTEPTVGAAGTVNAERPQGAEKGVIDLRSRQAQRRPENRMRWMSAAAAFLVFGFGAVFLASQMNSADDTTEVAVAADEAAEESSDEAEDAAEEGVPEAFTADDASAGAAESSALSTEATDAAPDKSIESESMAADAEADMTADAAEESDDDAAESTDEDASSDLGPPIFYDEVPPSGFFPDEPVVSYSNVPTSDDFVNNLDLRWRTADLSRCATEVSLPEAAEIIGYLPVEITQADGALTTVEALYVIDGASYEVILVDLDTCNQNGSNS